MNDERERLLEYRKWLASLSSEEKKLHDLELKQMALGVKQGTKMGYPSLDKPWLKYYSDDTIKSDIPCKNIYQYMKLCNKDNLKSKALDFAFKKISYHELFKRIDEVANSLMAMGLRKGDVIASLLPNTPEAVYIIYGAAKIGVIVDLIDCMTSKDLLAKYCQKSNPKIVIALDVMSENALANLGTSSYNTVVTVSPVQSLPVLNLKPTDAAKNIPYDGKTIINWNQFRSMGRNTRAWWYEYEPDMPAAILHTGGTTGIPKGAVLTHDNLNSLAHQMLNSPLDMQKKETALSLMPPFASYGLGNGIHVHLCAGMEVILIPDYNPSAIEDQILKFKPNRIACSPAHYEYIKNGQKLDGADLSFLRHPIEGGNSLAKKIEIGVNEKLEKGGCKDKIAKGYGLTETCSAVCLCVNNEVNKLLSVGIPLVKNTIAAFDIDDPSKELPYNVDGDIAILSPNNMLEYLGEKEETEETLITHDDGTTWLHTKDLGHVDEDGNIFIIGRLRRMIIQHGGLKSNPFEAEEQIIKHPLVQDAVVVGVNDPDHEQGELPVAYVLVDTKDLDKEDQLKQELHKICSDNVTYYSVPVDFVLVDHYPRTRIAKIDYRALAREYNENIGTRNIIRQRQLKI